MRRRISLLLLAIALPLLFLALVPLLPAAARPLSHPLPQKIAAGLRAEMAEDGGPLSYIVHLAATADLRRSRLPAAGTGRPAAVVRRLRETANATQAGLLRQLAALQQEGAVAAYEPLWIINAVAVTGNARAVEEIAARPEVARITLDARQRYVDEPELMERVALDAAVTWGLERIRAPHVWHGLGIDGTGATVAIVDTGVDWTHPALSPNYRGLRPDGSVDHESSWYDAVDGVYAEPSDPNGHGTHVAGTVAGQGGIGVAPGAQWLAVRAFQADGFATASMVHRAFQWLLAPGGDPALAPDIVNGSWGGPAQNLEFVEDVDALHAAGIITVFAAGNLGPESGTVTAPASYTDTVAVAASDRLEEVAWFSSYGPSHLTQRVKPTLAAPGTNTLSTLPGDQYAYFHGTSMATPHVAGALALLHSAAPGVGRVASARALTETAVTIGGARPNYAAGWGRLDAYAAVSTVAAGGWLQGTVHDNGQPLPGAALTVTTPGGAQLPFLTDAQGHYRARLQPGRYQLTAATFGHLSNTLLDVNVAAGSTTTRDVNLPALPHGTVTGRVLEAGTGRPLTATVAALQTPVTTTTAADGSFTLLLPSGDYDLRASHTGHRLGAASVTVNADVPVRHDFSLAPTMRLLLVDSGDWYFGSQAGYFRDALTGLGYAYDGWTIHNPFFDLPPAEHLGQYDAVIWSDPAISPGYLGADRPMSAYLEGGGNLLISGQNLGEIDGVGLDRRFWWDGQLDATYLANATAPFTVTGTAASGYEGVTFTLNGGSSADNQSSPDQARPADSSLTQAVLQYAGGEPAALQAGRCEDYEIIYYGFGLEGVSARSSRLDLVQRSIDHFNAPPVPAGLSLQPGSGAPMVDGAIDDYIRPGYTLTYTLRVRNLSETTTDTISIDLSGSQWPASVVTPTLTVGPCAERTTQVTVAAPPDLPRDTQHQLQVSARSALQSDLRETITIRHKTPGHTLLVQDERWYSQAIAYETGLDDAGLAYDVWNTSQRGSPPADLLPAYDFIFWYTGYDWFRPVTDEEIASLTRYLREGGRLFLSSQDYLYYHRYDLLTTRYFGVLDYQESVTPTVAYAGDNALLGDPAGPFLLDYPFRNWSDGVVPAAGSQVHLWHNRGMPAGVATAGEAWRTIFWSIPLETMAPADRASTLTRVAGWLGDLGDSTFAVDRRVGSAPTRTYTLTLRNLPAVAHQVAVTNTLPPSLTLAPASLTGGALYDPVAHEITWHGSLPAGGQHRLVYEAVIPGDARPGARIDNAVTISYASHRLSWRQTASTWFDAPDLAPSTLHVSPTVIMPGRIVTYTAIVHNDSLMPAAAVSATLRLPDPLTPLTPTLRSSSGLARPITGGVRWQGDVGPGQRITVTLGVSTTDELRTRRLPSTLVVEDGVTVPLVRDVVLRLLPHNLHFPFVAREGGNG